MVKEVGGLFSPVFQRQWQYMMTHCCEEYNVYFWGMGFSLLKKWFYSLSCFVNFETGSEILLYRFLQNMQTVSYSQLKDFIVTKKIQCLDLVNNLQEHIRKKVTKLKKKVKYVSRSDLTTNVSYNFSACLWIWILLGISVTLTIITTGFCGVK